MTFFPSVPTHLSLNCRGRILTLDRPRIMGILNLTPDSFSDGGRYTQLDQALFRAEQMLTEGADILDVGGYSSRPGADHISAEEELRRIEEIVRAILDRFPETLVSIDTFRATVARRMLEVGVHLINDISAGTLDTAMWETLVHFGDVPYMLMHMQGRPQTMQENPQYVDIFGEVLAFLAERVQAARAAGLKDIVIDPGFGFGKTILHNYQLWGKLDGFAALGLPVLVGVSRKSMLYRFFETEPGEVLSAATALHLQALQQGVHILRVHDVGEAKRIGQLFSYLQTHGII